MTAKIAKSRGKNTTEENSVKVHARKNDEIFRYILYIDVIISCLNNFSCYSV
jgi:hypothetical protein